MRVGSILREPLVIQGVGSGRSSRTRVSEMLGEVGLPRVVASSGSLTSSPAASGSASASPVP